MRNKEHGFSLIEILITLAIVAIVSTIAMFHFGDFGQKRRAWQTLETLQGQVAVLQEKAQYEARPLAIKIDKNAYTPLYLNAKKHWVAFQERAFSSKKLSDGLFFKLDNAKPAWIYIMPDGFFEPISLNVINQAQQSLAKTRVHYAQKHETP